MSVRLKNRSLLSLVHHTPEEVDHLVRLAVELKEAKRLGKERQCLRGKNIALIFEKASTRTRAAFEVAAHDQGAHTTVFDSHTSHFGLKESVRDSARVLGRMFDAIEYRGASQRTVEELAEFAGVPVFNGLTDEWHPTQMLADLMTMREASGRPWRDIAFAYLGDARNNMGHSLLMAGAKMGMDVRIGAPAICRPRREVVDLALEMAKTSGAYQSEYVRGALLSIRQGQIKAAYALGFTKLQTILWVVIPQAARRALPGCGNEIIYLIKYSSLAYIITCIELTGEAKVLVSRSFRPTEVYIVAGIYYLVLVSFATWFLQKLERKFAIPGFGKK